MKKAQTAKRYINKEGDNMFDLNGKTALVTGSTQGIGFDIAKTLSQHGAKVFVHGSGEEKCRKASAEIPGSVPVWCNLKNEDCDERLYAQTGDVDILVLNASVQTKKKWNEYTKEDFDTHTNVNVKSSYFLIKKYAPKMQENKWGRIVTIGSVNQYNQHSELSIYGMTKCAQYKLVRNIAPYLAPYGVTINNVAPGAISTPRNEADLANADFKKLVESRIPAGFIGEPKDISPAVLMLCSEEGRYITGTEIVADGGMSL